MNYYYLNGIDKKGPYTFDEIKSSNLPPNTLVLREGMSEWVKFETLTEFSDEKIIKNTESTQPAEAIIDGNEIRGKIKVSSYVFLFAGVLLCVAFSGMIVHWQRKSDLLDFNNKINAIMSGKSIVSDYSFSGTEGRLYKVFLGNIFDGVFESSKDMEKNVLKTEKHTIAYKPSEKVDEKSITYSWNERQKKYWGLFKDIKEYYEADRFSGFSVNKLERSSDNFTITEIWSGDMAYKVPASTRREGYSDGFISIPGYDIPTYRPSIFKCYEEAAKFLTVEDKDKSYVPGCYSEIDRFKHLESDFYEIEQNFPKYYRAFDTTYVDYGSDMGSGKVIDEERITSQTSRSDAHIFNSQWIVWYKSIDNRYSIEEKKNEFLKKTSIYSLIGSMLFACLFFLIKYKNKIEIK